MQLPMEYTSKSVIMTAFIPGQEILHRSAYFFVGTLLTVMYAER